MHVVTTVSLNVFYAKNVLGGDIQKKQHANPIFITVIYNFVKQQHILLGG